MILDILLVPVFCILFIYLLNKYIKWKINADIINKLPGPKAYPVIGNALMFRRLSPSTFLQHDKNLEENYGLLYRFWFSMKPIVIIGKPEYAEVILSSQTKTTKGILYRIVKPLIGSGLITSAGFKWHQRRKMLAPVFRSTNISESYFQIIIDQYKIFQEQLDTKINATVFDICPLIIELTFNVICGTVMGRKNLPTGDGNEFAENINKIVKLTYNRIVKPWLRFDFIFKFTETYGCVDEEIRIFHRTSAQIIQERRNERELNQDQRKDTISLVDRLLTAEANPEMKITEQDTMEEVNTFLFAGNDTINVSLEMLIFLISTHSNVQDKIARELFNIFGDSDRPPTQSDLLQLEYLQCTINEGLRLYPPVPIIGRELQEDVILGKHFIPSGTIIHIPIHRIHRRQNSFPDPDKFNPDNFLPENCMKRHPYSYIPFSAGPRNCIGQKLAVLQIKVTLSSLLRKYQINCSQTEDDLNLTAIFVLKPQNEVRIQLTRRDWKQFRM